MRADRARRQEATYFEAHAVEREARQLAHLHLPLHERVRVGVAVDAHEQELLLLLVVAVVRFQHLGRGDENGQSC